MRFLYLLIPILIAGCNNTDRPTGSDGEENPPPAERSYEVVEAFPNLSFTAPLDLQHAGDNSNRLFVVEQRGVIQVFENSSEVMNKSVFLDIQNKVDDSGNEEGLLGLAFHPDFESNGYFFVNYTASNPARTVIARFQVSDQNPGNADPSSEEVILTFDQPYDNHNGGQMAFGPEGYLYIAVGDGGAGGDPNNNGQNRQTLLGSILRIDINNREGSMHYAIPPENPYAGNTEGYREEIYAYGLRNPWRFSFDPENGRLWAGDVGQNSYEEIDIIKAGGNYGWDIMEGTHCYESSTCDRSGLELPVWEYGREDGISVTGGYVYRGPTLNELTGQYIYGDFGTGKIWALDYSNPDNPENTELVDTDLSISSFGTDGENRLFICAFDGSIYRLESTSP